MIQAAIAYLKTSAAKHVAAIAFVIVTLAAGRSWLAEHDARILAQATVQASQGRVADLQKQMEEVTRAGDVQIAKLHKQAEAVKTPAQAIAALPEVTTAPLNPAPLPDAPSAVKVEALPLYDELNKCAQCSVKLDTATKQLAVEKQVEAEKDTQITALKKKRGFWKTFANTAEAVGIGVAIGYVAHR